MSESSSGSSAAVTLRDCRLQLGESVAFAIDELGIAAGGQVAITGPSGCGKSTLLHLVSGLLLADAGQVQVLGKELGGLSGRQRDRFRGREMGFIYQTFNLLPHFNALENILIGLRFGRSVSRRERRDRARAALAHVGLEQRSQQPVYRLSIGEQQRVAVARALVNRPRLLLADEPTGSLDPKTGNQVFDMICDLVGELGSTFLMVTHDLELAGRLPTHFDARDLIRQAGAEA